MAAWEEAQPSSELHERSIATLFVDLCLDASLSARAMAFLGIQAG